MSKSVMSLADIKKRMAVSAEGQRQRLATTGGNVIGTRNERFSFKGQMIGDTFKCTVVDFAQQNAYYGDEPFDPDNITPPACVAISHDGNDMVPDPKSPDVQNSTCDGCPNNAFGSAEIGRGKACKNQYRLLVIPHGVNDAREAETAFLTLPPTSIKKWNEYVIKVTAQTDLPVWGVETEFYFDNDDVNATFKMLLPRAAKQHKDAKFLSSIIDMEAANREILLAVPDFSNYEQDEPKPKRKRAPAKKKAAPKTKAKAKAKPRGKSTVKKSKFS